MAAKDKAQAAGNKQAVAVRPESQLSTEVLESFYEASGEGFEETDSKSFAIPFLRVLQAMSKQVKRANPEYVDGAQEGMLFNTVTGELVDGDQGVMFIPCFYRRKYIEWEGTVDEGGGFVAEYNVAEGEQRLAQTKRDDKGNDRLPNGHIIQDFREHYGLVVNPSGSYTPVLLSMASSQIKKSKKWMSAMGALRRNKTQAKPDAMYTHIYHIVSVPEKKDNFDFFGIQISHLCGLENLQVVDAEGTAVNVVELLDAARAFREAVMSGAAKPESPADVEAETFNKF